MPRGRGGHPERHGGAALPSGERAGRCSRPGTGYCPPLGPDRGGTHRLRPAASPAGTAPSLLAEAASGAPGSAPAGPGAQRCHSGREQPRPVFCSAGPGKRPGVAWRPPEPGVPVPGVLETGDGRAEKARSFPSRRCSLARSQPEGCGRAARGATRASAIRGGAGGGGRLPLLLSRFRGLRSGQASLTRRGAAGWGRTTNPSVPRGAAPDRSAAAGGRKAFWDT